MDDDSHSVIGAHVQDARDMGIAKDCAEMLHKKYPGHLWAVSVRGGVIVIKNLRISTSHGYVVHLESYYADPNRYCIVRAGGELLERAGMARARSEGVNAKRVDGLAEKYQPKGNLIR